MADTSKRRIEVLLSFDRLVTSLALGLMADAINLDV